MRKRWFDRPLSWAELSWLKLSRCEWRSQIKRWLSVSRIWIDYFISFRKWFSTILIKFNRLTGSTLRLKSTKNHAACLSCGGYCCWEFEFWVNIVILISRYICFFSIYFSYRITSIYVALIYIIHQHIYYFHLN